MSTLREAFDELAQDAPRLDELRHDPVRAARLGARRRRARRRRVRVAGVATTVALLAVGVLVARPSSPPAPLTPPGGGAGVSSYPERVSPPARPPRLPDRPGPVAAILEIDRAHEEFVGAAYEDVLAADGTVWAVDPAPWATLSPDGRVLVTEDDLDGRVRVHDLVTGETAALVDLEVGERVDRGGDPDDPGPPPAAHVLRMTESHWSPDGRRLLVREVLNTRGRTRTVILDVRRGSVVAVPMTGLPAGFTSTGRVVTVEQTSARRDPLAAVVHLWDPETGADQRMALHPRAPSLSCCLEADRLSVSPDGSTLLVGNGRGFRLFDLATGEERVTLRVPRQVRSCPVAWRDGRPVVANYLPDGALRVLQLGASSGRRVIALDPSSPPVSCVAWAADAIDGDVEHALFGTWPWWWSFHVGILLAGLVALVVAVLLLVRWRRRRRWDWSAVIRP